MLLHNLKYSFGGNRKANGTIKLQPCLILPVKLKSASSVFYFLTTNRIFLV